MHDQKGRPLQVGDLVLIPAVVRDVGSTPDYCNVSVESHYGRKPDGQRERINAVNTNIMLRHNVGDTNDWPEIRDWVNGELSGAVAPEEQKADEVA